MTVRTSRRVLFAATFLLAPAPLLVLTTGWMPPATYALLTGVCALQAASEGADGAVPRILAMFAAHTAVYLLLSWLVAWLASSALARLSPTARRAATLAIVATGLAVAVGWDVYRTPFGRRPYENAIEALS
ncbi:MAG TPA: hypothetical protein VFD92_23995 [Candidatus Binatia bacterium]|nr:hypothetical protein [Candidatus Binatia bacterium]